MKECVGTCLFGSPGKEDNCALEKNAASVHMMSKCRV